MAIIQSGTTPDLLNVDPTSKALRISLYQANGESLLRNSSGSYVSTCSMISTTANSNIYAAFVNEGPRTAVIRTTDVTTFANNVTPTAATVTVNLQILYGTDLVWPSNIISNDIHKKRNSYPDPSANLYYNLDPGIVAGGAGPPGVSTMIATMAIPRSVATSAPGAGAEFSFRAFGEASGWEVGPGSALLLINTSTTVIQSGITWFVDWDEY